MDPRMDSSYASRIFAERITITVTVFRRDALDRVLPTGFEGKSLLSLPFDFEIANSYPRECHSTTLRKVVILGLDWTWAEHNIELVD
jgi:hypothetical protein